MRRHTLRAAGFLSVLLVTAPLLLGMGTTGGRDVLNPALNFKATLVDRDGVTVEVNRLNIGGDVDLSGDMGRGTLRIAFDNIQRIDFSADAHSRDFTSAIVHLKTGQSVTLRVRDSLMIYGQTSIGVYQIRARDLRSITFRS